MLIEKLTKFVQASYPQPCFTSRTLWTRLDPPPPQDSLRNDNIFTIMSHPTVKTCILNSTFRHWLGHWYTLYQCCFTVTVCCMHHDSNIYWMRTFNIKITHTQEWYLGKRIFRFVNEKKQK